LQKALKKLHVVKDVGTIYLISLFVTKITGAQEESTHAIFGKNIGPHQTNVTVFGLLTKLLKRVVYVYFFLFEKNSLNPLIVLIDSSTKSKMNEILFQF
jgi:hypothetical protein